MKFFIFFLILSISATAATLSYSQTEFVFEPGRNIEIPFTVKNKNTAAETTAINVDAGKLKQYASEIPNEVTLSPKETKSFKLIITPPVDLPRGLYPVSVTNEGTKGFARGGVRVIFYILHAFETGHPYTTLTVQPNTENVEFQLTTQNIGLTQLITEPKVELKDNGKTIYETTMQEMLLNVSEKKHQQFSIPVDNIDPGQYLLVINTNGVEVSENVTVKEPTATVTGEYALKSGQTNNFTIQLNVEWNVPFDSIMYVGASDISRTIFLSQINQTLYPGLNEIPITAKPTRSIKNKEVNATIKSVQGPSFKAQFPIQIKEFDKNTATEEDIAELEEEFVEEPENNLPKNIIIIALLAIAGIIFLIAAFWKHEKKEPI